MMERLIIIVGNEIYSNGWKEKINEEEEIEIFLKDNPSIDKEEISKTAIQIKN